MLQYNSNSKQLSLDDDVSADEYKASALEANVRQINRLTQALVAESNPNFTPQPTQEATNMIKKMFEAAMQHLQKQRPQDALRGVDLALDMRSKARHPWEAFAFQLQELQMMLRNKTDLELATGRLMDALQDLEMLQGCGMIVADVFVRTADVLLKMSRYEEAKAAAERGLSLEPDHMKLKALHLESVRKLADYNGDI